MSISALATSVPRRAPMPKVRCTSALLITMSTLPPISPASSLTERPLVRSSGTSVTCGSAVMSSRPRSFFHGSAWPTQTMSAPAFTSACTIAWPTAVLPSVTSTLRNFGSLVISRSILSSAMWAAPFVGKSDQHRLPGAVEPGADAHARAARRRPRRAGAPSASGRRRAAPGRAATAGARGRTGRCCGAAWCVPSSSPSPRLRAPAQARRQAAVAGLARRVLHGAAVLADLQLEAALGGGGRHAERDAAARARRQVHLPRAQDGVLALGAASAASSCRSPQDHGAGAQAAVVGDHAEAADQAELAHRAPRARRPRR